MNKQVSLGRVGLVLALSIGFEIFILTRLVSLQLFQYSKFQTRVSQQSKTRVKVTPVRGRIYDRFMRILATSLPDPSSASGGDGQAGIKSKRVYPLNDLAGNLLGFVGRDGSGLEGIEYEFDYLLSGNSGWTDLGKTPSGKLYPYPGYSRVSAQSAQDIVLTIDADIQAIAEESLKKRVNSMRASSGSVVILNPGTGEILAMVTIPCINPGNWAQSKRTLNGLPTILCKNRALQVQFEPGSTFKIIPISAIVENELVVFSDTVEDGTGEVTIEGKTIHDLHPHGPLTFTEAVWKSSNVAFVYLANLIGRKRFYEAARAFGFGVSTGITLPGEARGSLSSPDNWSDLEFANLAFGQGMSCNLLQLALAYSVIANGGILLEPIIIKEILSNKGKVIYTAKPIKVRKVLSEDKAKKIKELLCGVINEGTGILAKIPGLDIAGKTGTSQKYIPARRTSSLSAPLRQAKRDGADKAGGYGDIYTVTFVGFFSIGPSTNEQILIACLIDEPKVLHLGGQVCGPMFKEIAQKTIRLNPYRTQMDTEIKG
ncbi:penicillin-binding protein 2 [candidate division WOR-3 bacterium]|nr:penicillin-binding protein 2 [candidate division WOR-3 bacterium]